VVPTVVPGCDGEGRADDAVLRHNGESRAEEECGPNGGSRGGGEGRAEEERGPDGGSQARW
jgi:hypothetical protein